MSDNKIKLVLCWHMHQPDYRDMSKAEYRLPWTYLHVIKDYIDMAAHLEAFPQAKAVVNFAPILLEQIEDYASQVSNFLHDGIGIRDPLLAALASPSVPANPDERLKLVKACIRANREQQVNRYPHYRKLVEMAEWLESHHDALSYMNSQYLADILTWYHLAWMGETVKKNDLRIKRLLEKGAGYTLHERIEVVEVIGDLLASVIHRYKILAKRGQIELSVTPYAHPILPLLLDLKSTHQAMPDAPLPELPYYPGGEQRARWHVQKGIQTFERFFGFTPRGCWPAEGSVSLATLKILAEFGFSWTASGGNVLRNSLNLSGIDEKSGIHHPFSVSETGMICFFRDDGLSDLIGFDYSKWHTDDAVSDWIRHLENIARLTPKDAVVSVIMDGENAWEYFPENGYYFFNRFYQALIEHPNIELTTFSDCLDSGVEVKNLPKLVAGSWVYGTFSTWIGDADKNRGWDMLGDAKRCFDAVVASGKLDTQQLRAAELQLAICEGSDWFWWFGDYNPGEAVSDFEQQFRLNLTNLYHLLGEEAPAYLSLSFTQGSGTPALGGTMRHGSAASH